MKRGGRGRRGRATWKEKGIRGKGGGEVEEGKKQNLSYCGNGTAVDKDLEQYSQHNDHDRYHKDHTIWETHGYFAARVK